MTMWAALHERLCCNKLVNVYGATKVILALSTENIDNSNASILSLCLHKKRKEKL